MNELFLHVRESFGLVASEHSNLLAIAFIHLSRTDASVTRITFLLRWLAMVEASLHHLNQSRCTIHLMEAQNEQNHQHKYCCLRALRFALSASDRNSY